MNAVKTYACTQPKFNPGKIGCVVADPYAVPCTIPAGHAVQFYILQDVLVATQELSELWPHREVWFCDRQGGRIAMLVPKDTPRSLFPRYAMDYIAYTWYSVVINKEHRQ